MFETPTHALLKLLSPETAHDLAKWGMGHKLQAPGPYLSTKRGLLLGTALPNVLGLAAGFDKNGVLLEADAIEAYGFGFVEVGSVTWRGGVGNPKPRMFRMPDGDAPDIMNRMGLNGDPAAVVETRLKAAKTKNFGVNIAKTHDPNIMGDAALRDILDSYNLLKSYGMYTVINISCPNTKEGKTFEEKGALKELLGELYRARAKTGGAPMLLKLSPLLKHWQLEYLLELFFTYMVDGLVMCNTVPYEHPQFGRGGRSGKAVKAYALEMIRFIRQRQFRRTIIGVGGIYTGQDALDYVNAGADAIQAYNGFVRGPWAGAQFAHDVNQYLDDHTEHDAHYPDRSALSSTLDRV